FQAEDGIRDRNVTGVQTCALPISPEMSRCPLSWQQANVVVEGRCCYLGHSQDRQHIRHSPAALWQAAPPPDAIVQRKSADIKREIGRASCRESRKDERGQVCVQKK